MNVPRNPINRPGSANTTATMPISPKVEISHSALRSFTRHVSSVAGGRGRPHDLDDKVGAVT
jgi:hypothetical protein